MSNTLGAFRCAVFVVGLTSLECRPKESGRDASPQIDAASEARATGDAATSVPADASTDAGVPSLSEAKVLRACCRKIKVAIEKSRARGSGGEGAGAVGLDDVCFSSVDAASNGNSAIELTVSDLQMFADVIPVDCRVPLAAFVAKH